MKNILLIIAILAIFISTNPYGKYVSPSARNIYVATIYTSPMGRISVGVLNNVVSVAEIKDFLTRYPEF